MSTPLTPSLTSSRVSISPLLDLKFESLRLRPQVRQLVIGIRLTLLIQIRLDIIDLSCTLKVKIEKVTKF